MHAPFPLRIQGRIGWMHNSCWRCHAFPPKDAWTDEVDAQAHVPAPGVVLDTLVQLGAAAALQANVAAMCEELRVSLSPILSRLESSAATCKRGNPRKKRKVEATPSRRSARIAKHATTRQQQVLIT